MATRHGNDDGREHDVVVVGAGIVGAACAFRLAEAGLDVAVVERNDSPAMESTGRSAAGVRVQFTEAANVALSLASIAEFRDFAARHGRSSGYRPQGYLFLVPEDAWEAHLDGVAVQRSLGAPVEVLEVEQARRRFDDFDPRGLAGATYGPIDGVVDPDAVTSAYLVAARDHGAVVQLASPVTAIRRSDGWELTTRGGRTVRGETIVNAAGCWAGEVAAMAGLDLPVRAYRRMVFATGPRPGRRASPLTVDVDSGLYFRSEGDRLILGRSNPDEPPGIAAGIDWDWLEPTVAAATRRFPWFAEEGIDRRASWHGHYAVTPDHNPVLGVSAPGWVDACGFSGHGVQQAPAVGRAVAELVTAGASSSFDLAPFRPDRFRAATTTHEAHIV